MTTNYDAETNLPTCLPVKIKTSLREQNFYGGQTTGNWIKNIRAT